MVQQPVQKSMCTFFCFLKTVSELYNEEIRQENGSKEIRLPDLPSALFYDTSINYFDMERVGGLASYLYKTCHTEVSTNLSIPDYFQENQQSPSNDTTTGTNQSGLPTVTAPALPVGFIHVSAGVGTDDGGVTRTLEPLPIPRPPLTELARSQPNEVSGSGPPPAPPLPPPPQIFLQRSMPQIPRAGAAPASVPGTEPASATSSIETVAIPPITHFGALITGTPR